MKLNLQLSSEVRDDLKAEKEKQEAKNDTAAVNSTNDEVENNKITEPKLVPAGDIANPQP